MSGLLEEMTSSTGDRRPLKGCSPERSPHKAPLEAYGTRLMGPQAHALEKDLEYLDREAMKAEFFRLIDAMCR